MTTLKREIGFKTLVLLSINAILGTGIFFLPAIGAMYAGPASLISWMIMAIVAVFISFYFAELVSMFPKAGGVYEFVKRSFGEFPSFIVGWTAWIIANITIAMLIVGSLIYLLGNAPFYLHILLSLFLIILLNYISYKGIKHGAKMLFFFGIATLTAILVLIFSGILVIEVKNFLPFLVFPVSSIFIALFFISETFFGWETATFLAEETKNARKILPKALIVSTAIIAFLTIALSFVALGVVNWKEFSLAKAPLAYLASVLFGSTGGKIFALFMFIPLIGTAAGWIVSSPRLLMAMARDKLLIPQLQKVHSKYRTPRNAIIFQTIVVSVITFIGFASYKVLLSLLLPLVIIVYSIVLLCIVKLRITKPDLKRYYKAPFGRTGPIVIILFNFWLLFMWLQQVEGSFSLFLIGLMLIAIGIPIYALIKLQDRRFVEKLFNVLSYVYDFLLPFWYGKKERKKLIDGANIKNGNIVLDYGCATGIDIPKLVKLCGGKGKVVALDISIKQLGRSMKRIEKLSGLPNVILVKEEKKGMTFEKNTFDAILSVSILTYQKEPEKFLSYIHKILKAKGRVSILDFGKALFFPPPEHLESKKKIYFLFKKTGFKNIEIKEKMKWFTKYYFITAEK